MNCGFIEYKPRMSDLTTGAKCQHREKAISRLLMFGVISTLTATTKEWGIRPAAGETAVK